MIDHADLPRSRAADPQQLDLLRLELAAKQQAAVEQEQAERERLEISEALRRIVERLPPPERETPPCPALAEGEHCDGAAHYSGDPAERPRPLLLRRCPEVERREVEATLKTEARRLAGPLSRCRGGLDSYDPARQAGPHAEAAEEALAAARAFAAGRPPTRGLILAGPLGLGKTHLLLGAHFRLLRGGVRSRFVTTTDLRDVLGRCVSRHPETQREAERERGGLLHAQVLIWDDAGDVDGDKRWKGAFASGIKHLLDRGKATWAISTNLRWEQALRHPDVGAKVISRLVQGAVVVRMDGHDQRARTR